MYVQITVLKGTFNLKKEIFFTVLFPRFLTLQLSCAVLPTRAVTFLDAVMSKKGPRSSGMP